MGFNSMAISLLEKMLIRSKKENVISGEILNEIRKDNISTIVKLDTSITTLQEVNLNVLVGGIIRSVTVLNAGGGLSIQMSLGDAFEVFAGDVVEEEEIEILRWQGSGAGTAIIRITGVRL